MIDASQAEATDPFGRFAVGQHATSQRTVTSHDVVLFAAVTGDLNPVHVDEGYATQSQFGARIAHGMLTAGFISATMAMQLPGPGAVYLSQTLRFLRPVRINDTVTTRVEIIGVESATRQLTVATTVSNKLGKRIVEGEAVVLIPAVRRG